MILRLLETHLLSALNFHGKIFLSLIDCDFVSFLVFHRCFVSNIKVQFLLRLLRVYIRHKFSSVFVEFQNCTDLKVS